MAIAKKGSRKIMVNEACYLWKISPNTLDKVLNGGMTVVIQAPNAKRLFVNIRFLTAGIENDWNAYTFVARKFKAFTVTPKIIRKFIQYALSRGWQNHQADFYLILDKQAQLDEVLAEPCQSNDGI